MAIPLDYTIGEVLKIWKAKKEGHRLTRNYLQDHKFNLEAAAEDKVYQELDAIIRDIEIAIDHSGANDEQ